MLPPAPCYEGGPLALSVDSTPEGSPEEGWWFGAGAQRCSVPFSFLIGLRWRVRDPGRPVDPLHTSVEGWVESMALAHHASLWARQITRLSGAAVENLELGALELVPLMAGLADTWWRGPETLVAVYQGEADSSGMPRLLRAYRYDGLPEHAFWFDS